MPSRDTFLGSVEFSRKAAGTTAYVGPVFRPVRLMPLVAGGGPYIAQDGRRWWMTARPVPAGQGNRAQAICASETTTSILDVFPG